MKEMQEASLVVTNEMYTTAKELASIAINHPYTQPFFDTEHEFQVEKYWKHGEYDCKGMYDMLIPDGSQINLSDYQFKNPVILDIKVTNRQIRTAMFSMRSHIQGSWYTTGYGEKADFVLLFLSPGYKYPRWVHVSQKDLAVGRYGAVHGPEGWKLADGDLGSDVKMGWEQGLKLHDIYCQQNEIDWESYLYEGHLNVDLW
jgi:hypothetical protein